jgi:hypothetical protein
MFQGLRTIALIAAIILNCGSALAAEHQSADAVMVGCRAFNLNPTPPGQYTAAGFCGGLVEGLTWAAPDVCPPPEVTTGQAVRVVVKYIDDRPERLHERFNKLALEALRAAFPCTR